MEVSKPLGMTVPTSEKYRNSSTITAYDPLGIVVRVGIGEPLECKSRLAMLHSFILYRCGKH